MNRAEGKRERANNGEIQLPEKVGESVISSVMWVKKRIPYLFFFFFNFLIKKIKK